MKKKHFRHCDFIKVSKELLGDKECFKNILIDFLSKPIALKDKRRNSKFYEVTNLEIGDNYADDFEKLLITVVRTISYKTNK